MKTHERSAVLTSFALSLNLGRAPSLYSKHQVPLHMSHDSVYFSQTCFLLLRCLRIRFRFRLRMSHRHQLPHHQILLIKPLFPPFKILHLLTTQIFQPIQRPIQILRQHLLIKALTSQASTSISASEILVWSSWTIKVATRRNVEDSSPYGHEHRLSVFAVVRSKLGWSEDLEDERSWWCW